MSEHDQQDLQHKVAGAQVHDNGRHTWYEITLVPPQGATVAPPADLAALGDVDYQADTLEGCCAGCGEQRHDQMPPFGPHQARTLTPFWVHEPPAGDVDEDDVEQITQCQFGNTGSRVESCDRDAIEGTDRCAAHGH